MYSWQYPNILALAWTKKYVIVLAIIDIFTLQDLTKNKSKKISILILIATLGRLISALIFHKTFLKPNKN